MAWEEGHPLAEPGVNEMCARAGHQTGVVTSAVTVRTFIPGHRLLQNLSGGVTRGLCDDMCGSRTEAVVARLLGPLRNGHVLNIGRFWTSIDLRTLAPLDRNLQSNLVTTRRKCSKWHYH